MLWTMIIFIIAFSQSAHHRPTDIIVPPDMSSGKFIPRVFVKGGILHRSSLPPGLPSDWTYIPEITDAADEPDEPSSPVTTTKSQAFPESGLSSVLSPVMCDERSSQRIEDSSLMIELLTRILHTLSHLNKSHMQMGLSLGHSFTWMATALIRIEAQNAEYMAQSDHIASQILRYQILQLSFFVFVFAVSFSLALYILGVNGLLTRRWGETQTTPVLHAAASAAQSSADLMPDSTPAASAFVLATTSASSWDSLSMALQSSSPSSSTCPRSPDASSSPFLTRSSGADSQIRGHAVHDATTNVALTVKAEEDAVIEASPGTEGIAGATFGSSPPAMNPLMVPRSLEVNAGSLSSPSITAGRSRARDSSHAGFSQDARRIISPVVRASTEVIAPPHVCSAFGRPAVLSGFSSSLSDRRGLNVSRIDYCAAVVHQKRSRVERAMAWLDRYAFVIAPGSGGIQYMARGQLEEYDTHEWDEASEVEEDERAGELTQAVLRVEEGDGDISSEGAHEVVDTSEAAVALVEISFDVADEPEAGIELDQVETSRDTLARVCGSTVNVPSTSGVTGRPPAELDREADTENVSAPGPIMEDTSPNIPSNAPLTCRRSLAPVNFSPMVHSSWSLAKGISTLAAGADEDDETGVRVLDTEKDVARRDASGGGPSTTSAGAVDDTQLGDSGSGQRTGLGIEVTDAQVVHSGSLGAASRRNGVPVRSRINPAQRSFSASFVIGDQ